MTVKASRGFVYAVSIMGVTGTRTGCQQRAEQLLPTPSRRRRTRLRRARSFQRRARPARSRPTPTASSWVRHWLPQSATAAFPPSQTSPGTSAPAWPGRAPPCRRSSTLAALCRPASPARTGPASTSRCRGGPCASTPMPCASWPASSWASGLRPSGGPGAAHPKAACGTSPSGPSPSGSSAAGCTMWSRHRTRTSVPASTAPATSG